jgi:hypothetical protein
VGELGEQADIQRFAGEYAFRPTRAWQLTGLEDQRQGYDIADPRANNFERQRALTF